MKTGGENEQRGEIFIKKNLKVGMWWYENVLKSTQRNSSGYNRFHVVLSANHWQHASQECKHIVTCTF